MARRLLSQRQNMQRVDLDLEGDNGDLFDREKIRNYLVFVAGSVQRRKRLVAAVLVSIVALAIAALFAFPKTYHVESKLLAQRNQVLAVRGDGPDAVAPTRGAVETVLRRDNLVAIIQATDLVNHFREHRSLSQRVMGAVRGLMSRAETEEDRVDAMVELLEKRLNVWTNEGTVVIAIDWSDPHMAVRLVDAAQQNFLERRYAQEVNALAESIAILRSHAETLTADVDAAVAGVEKVREERQAPKGGDKAATAAREAPAPRPSARGGGGARPELVTQKLAIEAKQRVLDDLEQARRQKLAEAQTRLVEQRSTYTENHPIMIDLQQTISALQTPSPQAKALSQEIAALRADYDRERAASGGAQLGPAAGPAIGGAATPPQLPSEILRLDQELREDRDPATVYARARLRDAMEKYAALRAQVQAAQIDLETAQAAFKYRYSVLTPAQLPKRPAKPNSPLVLLAALFAGIFASIVAAVIADVRGGRLVERWQVEKLLDRPILGEMRLARLPGHDPQ